MIAKNNKTGEEELSVFCGGKDKPNTMAIETTAAPKTTVVINVETIKRKGEDGNG